MSSKIIFGLLILLFVAIVWIRMQWGRSKNKNQSKKIVDDLKSGKHDIESYAEALSIMIFSKPVQQEIEGQKLKHYLQSLSGKKTLNKFTVEYGDMNENKKGIVIGEGFVKDTIHDRQVDVFYPCWIYIDIDGNNISFKSVFPENKDHHYLLEDLSTEIYNQAIKN